MKMLAIPGWMCQTDFAFELGNVGSGNTIYPSEQNLRESRPCVEDCGVRAVITLSAETFLELAKAAGKTNEDFDYSSIGPAFYTKEKIQ